MVSVVPGGLRAGGYTYALSRSHRPRGKHRPMQPRGCRRKGARFEREVRNRLAGIGLEARKQPLSGQLDDWPGDVVFHHQGRTFLAECKSRKGGLRTLRGWLAKADICFHKQDRETDFLVSMPWSVFKALVGR